VNSATAESSKAKASFVGYKREAEGPDKSISANTRRLKSREILLRTPEEKSCGAVSKLLKTQVGDTPSMT
jgi:hypothetical protein